MEVDGNSLFLWTPTEYFSKLYFFSRISWDCFRSLSRETNEKNSFSKCYYGLYKDFFAWQEICSLSFFHLLSPKTYLRKGSKIQVDNAVRKQSFKNKRVWTYFSWMTRHFWQLCVPLSPLYRCCPTLPLKALERK